MSLTITLDEELVEEAREIGSHQTALSVVVEALQEYITRRKQMQIVGLFGTVDYDPDYDYKRYRNSDSDRTTSL